MRNGTDYLIVLFLVYLGKLYSLKILNLVHKAWLTRKALFLLDKQGRMGIIR